MAHFKTLIFVCTLFSANAFAQNIGQAYDCYDSLAKAGLIAQASFDRSLSPSSRPFYISQFLSDDKSFYVFRNREMLRCDFPKEGALSIFSSCKKTEKDGSTYNLDLKIGMSSYAMKLDVNTKREKKMHVSSEYYYRVSIPKDEKFCEVQCKDDLDPKKVAEVEKELLVPVSKGYASWEKSRDQRQSEAKQSCDSTFRSLARTLQNALSDKVETAEDCVKRANPRVEKEAEHRRQEVISALKSCSGGLKEMASSEISKLERKSPLPASLDPNVSKVTAVDPSSRKTADSFSDEITNGKK